MVCSNNDENKEPNKPAVTDDDHYKVEKNEEPIHFSPTLDVGVDSEEKDESLSAPDVDVEVDLEEDDEDPFSSMIESQAWPYDPNQASGIY